MENEVRRLKLLEMLWPECQEAYILRMDRLLRLLGCGVDDQLGADVENLFKINGHLPAYRPAGVATSAVQDAPVEVVTSDESSLLPGKF